MKRTTSGLTRVCAGACALVVASSLALGGAIGADVAAARAAIPSIEGRDVFTVTDDEGEPGDLFLTDVSGASGSSSSDASGADTAVEQPLAVTQVESGKRDIPLDVDVAYSLDGPNVGRTKIAGATGVVGVHVRVGKKLLDGLSHGVAGNVSGSSSDGSADAPLSSQRFLVVFTVPTRVADDVTVSVDDSIVGTQGSNTLIAAVARVGERIDCYMNATKFTMGPVAVVSASGASALAGEARAMGDGSATFTQPGTDGAGKNGTDGKSAGSGSADSSGFNGSNGSGAAGSSAAGSATTGGAAAASSASSVSSSGRYQRLIEKLTALRDLERSLAQSEIAEKQADYDKAFHAYMAAYVGSYTNHLSGSIGSSTQLTALMGTAGELSGDTPLAAAVLGEANATNALASAHQHTGAADAIEQVIRMVRAQGVTGLSDTLRRRAGEEQTEGAKEYSAGQSQLSQAMIPYSMAYTDAYTKHLSALTGGTSAGASAYRDQAIAATDKEFASGGSHAGDTAKVDAALSALASARERTGTASAYRQIVLRFADDLSGAASLTSDTAESDVSGLATSPSSSDTTESDVSRSGTAPNSSDTAGSDANGSDSASETSHPIGSDVNGSGSAAKTSDSVGSDVLRSLMVAGRGLNALAVEMERVSSGMGHGESDADRDSSVAARSARVVTNEAGGLSERSAYGSLSTLAEIARLRRQAAAERKAAKASSGDVTTTVIDESAAKTDSADVMKFAGAVPGAGKSASGGASSSGAAGSSDSGSSGTTGATPSSGSSGKSVSGGASGAGTQDGDAASAAAKTGTGMGGAQAEASSGSASSSGSGDGASSDGSRAGNGPSGSSGTGRSAGSSATAEALANRLSPYFGMIGMDPGPMLSVDTDGLINDTTTLSDAGELIAAALDQGADKLLPASGAASSSKSSDDSSSGASSDGGPSSGASSVTRFLIVEPGL
ncbi:hypothetical protein JS528_07795 [Bifidobacterium sp. MA2]|uniref:Tubuliform spidroin n=1 Tax=Bifidobacterium santillanense TaxID=2809028 RepID=A0ABS5UQS6_9BIFI|nr:hypothetical protein [Bifidobacterium santillanense]MBT1173252.1 hypothetical protein [Bifidobacterium santillanense]